MALTTTAPTAPPSPSGATAPPARARRAATVQEGRREAGLRAAAVSGDRAAFAALYLTYRSYVLAYLSRRCHGDRHLAEDLTQETFTRAFTGLSSYRETGRPFGAWLMTIAGNLLIDYWRSGWHRYQVPRHDFTHHGDDSGLAGTEAGDDPELAVVAWDRRHRLARTLAGAVGRLTDRQQQVVALRYLQGRSVTETAHTLGLDEGAVKAAAYRARQALAGDPRVAELR
jgi:RNA polymerase sigma-70 factor (ECF subfamily)